MTRWLTLRSCRVDLETGTIQRDGAEARLQPMELKLLAFLAEDAGVVQSRQTLFEQVWGYHRTSTSRTLDVTVRKLRAKIETDPSAPVHVVTVRGKGFRFQHAAAHALADLYGFLRPEGDHRALATALQGPDHMWTLTGPPGVGKSSLAREVLRTTGLPHRWVSLTGVTTAEALAQRLGAMLGLRLTDEAPWAAIVAAIAGHGDSIWVLDGSEGLRDVAHQTLARILTTAPQARLLCTSRRPLRLRHERIHRMGGLEEDLGVRLFHQHALRVTGKAIGAQHFPTVRRIVALLDGNPLAIQLAARRTALLSPPALEARLADGVTVLSRGPQDQPRHASLHAALQSSWDLLTSDDQHALIQLTVFRGVFSPAAAETVAASSLDCVSDLLTFHLLVHLPDDSSSLRVPHAVRSFARGKGAPAEDTRQRHAAWFARLGIAIPPTRGGPPLPETALADLLDAHQHATDPTTSAATGRAAFHVLDRLGPPSRAADLARALLARSDLPDGWSGRILLDLCSHTFSWTQHKRQHLHDVIARGLELQDQRFEGAFRTLWAEWLRVGGETRRALVQARQAHEAASVWADHLWMASSRRAEGAALLQLGQLEEAGRAFDEARGLSDDAVVSAFSASWLAVVRERQGRFTEALELHQEAVDRLATGGLSRLRWILLLDLAVTAMLAGDLARARAAASQAQGAFRRLGDALYTSVVTCTLAEIDLRDGQVERSVAANQAEIRSWVRGVRPSLPVRLAARVALVRGLAILGHREGTWEALKAAQSMPDLTTLPPSEQVMLPAAEAEVAAQLGDMARALSALARARKWAVEASFAPGSPGDAAVTQAEEACRRYGTVPPRSAQSHARSEPSSSEHAQPPDGSSNTA